MRDIPMANASMLRYLFCAIIMISTIAAGLGAQEPRKFRTDDNPNETLPWFQLVDGEFPPENSGHRISGELISVDHVERKFQIRVDRDDSQERGSFDLPLDAQMLPYGAIYLKGAPAAIQDIALGTHLNGVFYAKPTAANGKDSSKQGSKKVKTADFNRCFRLEDDFSFYARQNMLWKVDAVNLEEKTLTATLEQNGKPVGEQFTFDLTEGTRVFQGTGFTSLESIQAGQEVLFNRTWVTLYGPGRIEDLWLDKMSREQASQQQLGRHRVYTHDRGLAGWIDAVDDHERIVSITFFDGVDSSLFDELEETNDRRHGWPFSYPEDDPSAPKGGICVARDSLMTYDPVNDRKGGNIVKFSSTSQQPGSSGVQIHVKCGMLLEGFRPGRVVRFYPANWEVVALPREERYYGRE